MNYEMTRHALLSHLWLHEPDVDTIARATAELGLPSAERTELASAYADVFLLNVYPYSTAFTDPSAELNGPDAQWMAARYEAHGYRPPELNSVGAPDHLGLCLGFLASVGQDGILPYILNWAPVCCLAIEREPSAHPFYRALAARTRETLLTSSDDTAHEAQDTLPDSQFLMRNSPLAIQQPEDAVSLRDIVRFFLAPARCGLFLSRSRLGQMAKALGMRLPFGSRFEVAEMLFASAGEAERVERVLFELESEVDVWAAEYRRWAGTYPAWRPFAERWLARAADATGTLSEMRQMAATIPT